MREKNVFFLYYNINFFICQASALILSIGAPVLFNTDGRPAFVLNIGRIWGAPAGMRPTFARRMDAYGPVLVNTVGKSSTKMENFSKNDKKNTKK